ncbi:hypothetical protein K3495_g8525 [Podosphaera aphanis]|nr:hypothetical protein K3495_g8525 [Podosphaera aphanis]
MYDGLVQKMVMENEALLGSLRADNKALKDEIDSLRREVRSTYLAKRTPNGVPDKVAITTETTYTRKDSTMPSPSNPPSIQRNLPQRTTFQTKAQTVPLMSAIASTNAPSASKPAEWEVVGHKKAKKNAPKDAFPAPIKSVEEAKRRFIFQRSSEAPQMSSSTAQEILYSLNMKLLSMKLPAHLGVVKLRYNELGNLTGLTKEQTTAEIMISRFQEIFLKTALRFDPHIKEECANQQWIGLKIYTVELGRYYPLGGLEQIRKEVAAGPSAVELPLVPRWIVHPRPHSRCRKKWYAATLNN